MPRGQGYAEGGHVVGGRYRLVSIIGSGGMGTVWRAHDQVLDRPVAAKVLNIFFGQDSEDRNRRERSLREARATARINHPNVVRVYDYVEDDDRLWIVMELLAARSLDTVLDEDGPLAPREAAAIGVQIARALRTVHEHGVLHRDVKPGNVLIEPDGHAVLTDFGIAALEGTSGLTGTGAIVGSPEFMAPERIESESPGPASDLWSLGVTLCAAVTGKSPFRRPTPVATLAAIVIAEPEVPEGIGPLAPLVQALFARSPEKRPSAAEVMSSLEDVLATEGRRHADDPTHVVTALPADAQTWEMSTGAAHVLPAQTAAAPAAAAAPASAQAPAPAPTAPTASAAPAAVADDATASLLMPAARPAVAPVPGAPTEPLPRVPAPPHAEEVPVAPLSDLIGPGPAPGPGGGAGDGAGLVHGPAITRPATGSPASGSPAIVDLTQIPSPTPTFTPAELPGPIDPPRTGSPHTGGPAPVRPWWRRPVLWSVAAVVAAALVIGIVLASSGGGDGGRDDGGKESGASLPSVNSASNKPTSGTQPTVGAPASRPVLAAYPPSAPTAPPAGITLRTADESRFAWPVPESWTRAERDQTISYVASGRQSVLAARTAFKQTDDLLGAWREEERKAPAVLADYRRVLFEQRTIRGNPGVVWEYTWAEAGVERHAVLAAFLESGLYVEVDVFSNPDTWERDQALFHWALQNLRLATASAPAAPTTSETAAPYQPPA